MPKKPANPATESVSAHQKQIDANLDHYADIYKRCLDRACKIAPVVSDSDYDNGIRHRISETIFTQFFSDQSDAKRAAPVNALNETLQQRAGGRHGL